MDFSNFRDMYVEIFRKNKLDAYIKDEYIEKFEQLTRLMLETNAVMNITALTTLEKIIPLHYADCVAVAEYIPANATVLDLGCGGGFPILPLAIVRPDLRLTGLDSTEKKVRYVQATADALGLSIQTIAARAEDIGRDAVFRESFNAVISRAVARMNILAELSLPLVRVGGLFFAMKGAVGLEEAKEAERGFARLGAQMNITVEYQIHTFESESEKRRLYGLCKMRSTPSEYPRSFAVIKKKPL